MLRFLIWTRPRFHRLPKLSPAGWRNRHRRRPNSMGALLQFRVTHRLSNAPDPPHADFSARRQPESNSPFASAPPASAADRQSAL